MGEALSSRSLIVALRKKFPEYSIIFSTTTKTGTEAAKDFEDAVDLMVPFPLDFMPCVSHFINLLSPSLFILVESDFWPNFLSALQKKKIPAFMVNGRISDGSFERYRKLSFFFRPLFTTFCAISMQTEKDARKMISLGVPAEKVHPLGNLKYDSLIRGKNSALGTAADFGISEKKMTWIAGSTHPGEEELIFKVHKRLLDTFPDLFLVVAPRNIERADEVIRLAEDQGLCAVRKSKLVPSEPQVLVLDTLGELNTCYSLADIAFVGGTLVPAGGHNPLEPAVHGIPVLFGPHMEDFSEIKRDILEARAGIMIKDSEALFFRIKKNLSDLEERKSYGERARLFVRQHQGVTENHLNIVSKILGNSSPGQ